MNDETRLCPSCSEQTKPIAEGLSGHQLRVRCPLCGFRDMIYQGGHP